MSERLPGFKGPRARRLGGRMLRFEGEIVTNNPNFSTVSVRAFGNRLHEMPIREMNALTDKFELKEEKVPRNGHKTENLEIYPIVVYDAKELETST